MTTISPNMSEEDAKKYREYGEIVIQIRQYILSFFKMQYQADKWFEIPNPLLGGLTPMQMIQVGRASRLLQFIKVSLEENKAMVEEEKPMIVQP